MSAILTEKGFIDTKADAAKLKGQSIAGTKFTHTQKCVAGNQMEGNDVLAVQYRIGVEPYKDINGKVIGTFGPITREKLNEWQKKSRIKQTGDVGIVNWRKVFGEKKRSWSLRTTFAG